jgi:copper chaperone CopZ
VSYYVHKIPGRLRVKIGIIKDNPAKGGRVQELLHSLNGVETCRVNPVTGSVTVHYDTNLITCEQILHFLEENNYFDESKAIDNEQYIRSAVSNAGEAVGKVVFNWALGKAFEECGLSFLAALI